MSVNEELSLDLKYRPSSFKDVIGNNDKVKMITTLLRQNKFPHFSILYGQPGCGKTTLSYLITMSLLCENPINGEPCGKCDSCVELNNTLYSTGKTQYGTGVFTFNMTNHSNDLEYINNIASVITSKTTSTKRRVILVEELHVAAPLLQETLNDALEFLDDSVYVIVCTSILRRIATPIQRRTFQPLDVQAPTKEELEIRLKNIVASEGGKVTQKSIQQIVQVSNRIPRQALKTLGVVLQTGDVGLNVLVADKEIDSQLYLDYFNSIKYGIVDIISFVEDNIKEPIKFIRGLKQFVYLVIKTRFYPKTIISDNIRKSIKKDMSIYTDQVLVKTMKEIENSTYIDDEEAKAKLFILGFSLNPELYSTMSLSDAQNTINSSLEQEQEDVILTSLESKPDKQIDLNTMLAEESLLKAVNAAQASVDIDNL